MNIQKTLAMLLAGALSSTAYGACTLPVSLDGKSMINKTDPAYSPQNPNADSLLLLNFEKDRYTSRFLRSGLQVSGTYSYRLLAPGVGAVEAQEQFGDQTTRFRLVLVCANDVSGTLVFNQEQGAIKPDRRQNTGVYTIQ